MVQRNHGFSLLRKIILLAIYFPFFLVQVYLKFTPPPPFVSTGLSGISFISLQNPVSKIAAFKSGMLHEKNKLNTRYEEPSVLFYLINSFHTSPNNYAFIHGWNIFKNPPEAKQSICVHLLRGPPSLV